ncbi:MAG: hypothetical protein OEO23_01305 [Gemmatimonadota bacterium]|nr:hypothetical protein [Gemmatimonadota bacterium]
MRNLLAVAVPWLIWGALDTGIYAGLSAAAPEAFPAPGGSAPTWAVIFLLVLRTGYSVVAGFTAGRIAQGKQGVVRVAIGLLLVTGIAVQVGAWDQLPVWYHLTFLAAIVPAAAIGARRATRTG